MGAAKIEIWTPDPGRDLLVGGWCARAVRFLVGGVVHNSATNLHEWEVLVEPRWGTWRGGDSQPGVGESANPRLCWVTPLAYAGKSEARRFGRGKG